MGILEVFIRAKGLNRHKLGKLLDLSPPTIRLFLANPLEFKLKHFDRIATETGCTAEQLTGLINGTREISQEQGQTTIS